MYIEFYLKRDVSDSTYKQCAGSMLGYIHFTARSYEYVDNPFLEDNVCKEFYKK